MRERVLDRKRPRHTVLVEPAIAMTTVQQKAQSVLWLAEFKYVITVQRTFRRVYGGDPPHANSIRRWYTQFQETISVDVKKSPGRPRTSEETVERLRRSPEK